MDYDDAPKSEYRDPRDYRADHLQEFLKKISMLESSGGKKIDHKKMEKGIQAGDSAVGTYGIMPNTLVELAKRYPSEHTKGLSKEELELGTIVDRDMAHTMAGSMADYLRNRRGLSEEEAAAAWEAGHNKPVEELDLNSKRAKKFRVLSNGK